MKLLQTILFFKSKIRKDIADSVHKESMNKGSSKNAFLGFSVSRYYTFYWLLTVAHLEPVGTITMVHFLQKYHKWL